MTKMRIDAGITSLFEKNETQSFKLDTPAAYIVAVYFGEQEIYRCGAIDSRLIDDQEQLTEIMKAFSKLTLPFLHQVASKMNVKLTEEPEVVVLKSPEETQEYKIARCAEWLKHLLSQHAFQITDVVKMWSDVGNDIAILEHGLLRVGAIWHFVNKDKEPWVGLGDPKDWTFPKEGEQ